MVPCTVWGVLLASAGTAVAWELFCYYVPPLLHSSQLASRLLALLINGPCFNATHCCPWCCMRGKGTRVFHTGNTAAYIPLKLSCLYTLACVWLRLHFCTGLYCAPFHVHPRGCMIFSFMPQLGGPLISTFLPFFLRPPASACSAECSILCPVQVVCMLNIHEHAAPGAMRVHGCTC